MLDDCDAVLAARLYQQKNGGVIQEDGTTNKYEYMVVDEVQDFDPLSLSSLVDSVKELEHLTLVGDVAQSIRKNSAFPGWETLKKHWLGGSDASFFTLSVSHRTVFPIMRFADFILGQKRTKGGRKGKPPLWFKCLYENTGVTEVLSWLKRVLEKFPDELTAVICSDASEAHHVLSLLEPTFGAAVRLGDKYSFSFEEGIVVTDVESVKGLEFANILIWNPTSKTYPRTDEGRHKLYTAVTRAEDHLCMVTWGRQSRLLPNVYSKLVRGYERDIEDE